MSLQDAITAAAAIEECLDEISDWVATLKHHPPTAVAMAMSVHLQGMLSALLEYGLCTREQARELIRELEREALQEDETGA